MLGDEKIIVKDNSFDAGLAALMQQANKGNFDPASLLAMMNNNGFGNNGMWFLWLILLFFCWGGNGFNRNLGNSELNTDANTAYLMSAITGDRNAVESLANSLKCDVSAVLGAINLISNAITLVAGDTKLSSCEVINAITAGNANIASLLASCCCNVTNGITRMGYEDLLAMCNQTNSLTNTMNNNTLTLRDSNQANTSAILSKIDLMLNLALIDKIDTLRERNSTLLTQLSNEHQSQLFSGMITQATQPIVTQLGLLQANVDSIKCRLPETVTVQYPLLQVYNQDIYRAAALGAYTGDMIYNRTYSTASTAA